MITGLARAQAQYDSMEPPDGYYFTDAQSDRVTALVGAGMTAIRESVKETLGDLLSDIWAPEDSDAIRDTVQDAVLEEIRGALG